MTLDTRFALIADNGAVLYPYQKAQRSTGRFGFALSLGKNTDRRGGAEYTTDIEEVVRQVVLHGWRVRAKTSGAAGASRHGSFALGKRAISGYWLAPELHGLVEGAAVKLLGQLPAPLKGVAPFLSSAAQNLHALDFLADLEADDFEEAWEQVKVRATPEQRNMLIGHAQARDQTLSMQSIARLGGYASYEVANLQYGKLGTFFAEHFRVTGLANQTQALAEAGKGVDLEGHGLWTLRRPLYGALANLHLVEPVISTFGAKEAENEIDADPQCRAVGETQRQALVNARIGQGGYRTRMRSIWSDQCALTARVVPCALVASHAKPWAESSNEERLDEYNGLLLSASIDRLFDAGLISFADDGRLLVAPSMADTDLMSVGLSRSSALRSIDSRHAPYFSAHRAKHKFPA
ncbi:hypothetical protein BH11PSE9_BH11PSE9_34660 [soil metagenome]